MPSPAASPSTSATPFPVKARLEYVRRHLAQAYPGAPVELLGYEADAPVRIVALDAGFFAAPYSPYPPAPNWREWRGARLPFFFDAEPDKPLLTLADGRATLGADVVSAAFYLLSGWQEYFSAERDQHGRFPYAASMQKQYGFVALPVVNYYFDLLKTALEYVSGQPLAPRRWGPQRAPLTAFISHDVDNLRSAWKAPAKAALKSGKLLTFSHLLWRHLTQPDAWDNLEAVAAQVAQYGGRSTFFMLPRAGKGPGGIRNADYRLTPALQRRLARLAVQGCEIGLHGSLGSSDDGQHLHADYRAAPPTAGGYRFHYLRWEPRHTPALLTKARATYDSTLGFAEHFGFRNSYCLPFHPFDFETGQLADFLEIPLNVMDTTLHHPRYLQVPPANLLPTLGPMLAEIRRFGGVASILWHNENFDPANHHNGPREFHALMHHLQSLGAAFRTGGQIWGEFTQAE